jgi:hypothetical protein
MEQCSETSAHKIQTPEIHPKERRQHSEQGESFKSRSFGNNTKYENKRNPWGCGVALFRKNQWIRGQNPFFAAALAPKKNFDDVL